VPHLDQKDWQKSLSTNVDALAHLIPFVAPLLSDSGAAVFFDDPHGGEKFFGHYGTTKAAQMALVKSWQAESAKTGPRVHVLNPRPMATATRARFYPGEDRDQLLSPRDEAPRLIAKLSL
jgi:NAD(P)-dependent dehydrogenase (short-subunit alcohol dehydrogenase family)